MNTIKRIGLATFLVVLLTTTSFAGTIHTGVVNPPPSPPPEEVTATATPETLSEPGQISTGLVPSHLSAEIVMNLLQLLTAF